MMNESKKKQALRAMIKELSPAHWAAALGRLGGSANTAAQMEARRTNGRKGGRPKKKKGPNET